MRVLIIGGNGFLGSSLVRELRTRTGSIRVLDRHQPRADFDWSGIQYVVGAFDDADVLASALADIDVVFHLASTTVPSTSNADPVNDVQSNLIGTLRLVAAMRSAGIRRLVFFSSGGTVYGDPCRLPVDEGHPLNPISSYGVVKVAIENYLRMYQQLGELDPLIIRPSNPYGPGQPVSGVQGAVASFLGKARDAGTVTIWGDGEIVRDYVYVDDLMLLCATAGFSDFNGVVNAGSGEGHSLNQLCSLIRQATGATLSVDYLPGRAFDVKNIVLDVSTAKDLFGWTPSVSLPEGIARTWTALGSASR